MIKAPYNFVPLNKEIFYPSWADDISHDIPFEDGESGEIEITVTAKSPIYIQNHGEDKFCNYKGEFFIPGSSLRGSIRSIFEILTFSKMHEDSFSDSTYAVRDLSSAKNFYMTTMNPENIFCGYLKKVDGKYIIEDYGVPGRISHEDIDKATGCEFSKYFKPGMFDSKKDALKTSQYKYKLLKNATTMDIPVIGPFKSKKNAKYDKREFYFYESNSKKKGRLVVTGQPTPRLNNSQKGDGKGFEFLFFDKLGEYEVDTKVFENFLFAYFDERETQPKESPDWTFWKKELVKGNKVPIFFQKTQMNKIEHFGLSYLYKLPYSHSIKDGIYKEHFEDGLDMTQAVFGYIDKKDKRALKSRVMFSHLKALKETIKETGEVSVILGSPRASYYPNYIEQNEKNLYKTYMDANFKIAGRKRYPIHSSSSPIQHTSSESENVEKKMKPLKEGAIFKGKVRYHNLKKAELGALLSALTFHLTPNTYHSLGMGKPLGFGKVDIKIDGIENIDKYIKEFEKEITVQIPNWSESKNITELLTMAVHQQNSGNSELKYMEVDEFAKNKNKDNRDFLRRYSQLQNINTVKAKSLLTSEELKLCQSAYNSFLEKRKRYLEEKKLQRKYEKDLKIIEDSEVISQLEAFVKKYSDKEETIKVREKLEWLKEEHHKMMEAKKVEEERKKLQREAMLKAEEEAKKLEEERKKAEKLAKGLDFSEAKDVGDIERALKGFEKSDENKQKLIEAITKIYPDLNKKKKAKFGRSKELKKWLSEDGLKNLLERLN